MENVLLYILGVLILVVGLAVSIGLHEIGHLLPAKLFGVRVSQYMIGFGPTLFSRKRGETEYGLKAIPLGGYISMAGMFPPGKSHDNSRSSTTSVFQTLVQDARESSADTLTDVDESRAFYKLPVFKRIIIMLGGPFMNLLIAIVMFAILLMGFGTAQASTTISSVSECVIPASADRDACTDSDPAAPALAAGIQPDDRIVSMDGEPIESWEQITEHIRAAAGDQLTIVVERAGAEVTLTAEPLLAERYVYDDSGQIVENDEGEAQTEEYGFLGIGPAAETVQQPVTAVLPAVGDNVVAVAKVVLTLPQRMIDVVNAAFGPEERDPNGPIGLVGVGRIAGEATSLEAATVTDRAAYLISLVGSLNVALFVFNLVPLLPLDGGHVAGALFEGVRRFFAKLFGKPDPGPLDTAKFVPLTLVVVVLLGIMTLLLVYADIVKPISPF
ncbi:RIP metalloprotease [Salinibacterium sp. SWN248]|uniref:M50 family metallopeptidase n=1 Tax=Salinibacterium sp. SWN248 TaxID=2792056 RepID=UPI0018CE2453|nr:site-2 protease family protein [Salinibacterium sp. SWN248]MBH0025234.1 site-2 protease family protein [Salinibacterium sp. SWN248]